MNEPIVLIIPCYNEEKRIDTQSFAEYAKDERVLYFIDDGSKDSTLKILKELASTNKNIHYHSLSKNSGKAEAVRQGIIKALDRFPDAHWFGFLDADLATPLWEVENMLKYRSLYYPESIAIWGSRVYRLGSHIVRSPVRHYLSRVFATLAHLLLKIESYDSQCGVKLFAKSKVPLAFEQKFLSPWIFDIEILLRLKQEGIVEYPLQQWTDVAGSKISLKESLRVFRDLLKIRRTYKNKLNSDTQKL